MLANGAVRTRLRAKAFGAGSMFTLEVGKLTPGKRNSSFAKYWLHNGFVTINKEKMSKSLGNFFTLKEIYQKYPPQVVRLLLISNHYRSPLDFSENKLEDMSRAQDRFNSALNNMREMVDRLAGTMQINEKTAPPKLIAAAEARRGRPC